MKTKIIGLFFLTVIVTAFTISGDKGKIIKKKEFQKFIDSVELTFVMPSNNQETYVRENRDLWYKFAIKDKNADFEVRYSVWSLKSTIEKYV